MTNNPTYVHLLRLYADDNKIESFLDLEGTDFIQNFDTLHLRRNLLKTVSSSSKQYTFIHYTVIDLKI